MIDIEMELGIIGLPQSGKTTVFNALTGGKAEMTAYTPAMPEPNIGVAKVEDFRLSALGDMLKPKRIVPAEVTYIDVAFASGTGKRGEGFSGQLLNYLERMDGLIHVVRVFEDERIPHIEGGVDPERDISTVDMELAFSDLLILERRLKRLEESLKRASRREREDLFWEQSLLTRIKEGLEKEIPLRERELSVGETKLIENYQFLTAKPLLVLLNIGEEQLSEADSIEVKLSTCCSRPQCKLTSLCGKLEMEIAQLSRAEAEEFRTALGVEKSGVDRVIRDSYRLLGLVTFFTTASNEVKAWTVYQGATAPAAAGKIHSDMERGFIRAQVIGFDDLLKCGSMAEARRRGLLRLEGKEYIVRDGDVINFLFNV
jgi:hypothetical protein